ncbi:pre-mRNA-splicing factor PRP9, putative [Entamoeba invadens IP1]|uniref:Pre-mRNA-splicing factor PRP9, putative n=1 Tax=Entamoeba invadens IP1 TaxID=370355 RepID=A0A0A1U885_ENTIV|nr:pre-mRNA-splicing factor PRP9, putative [Entamoeba invadens IP1]ELP91113.1 pre-mRNA-splicing factor PRP9, putative [Entamoeba invadens IP1]|eukprot:XP_004257884.1 pre-mRNA-splicing factor PRP9, putative [Entamoeba invadens IP1]
MSVVLEELRQLHETIEMYDDEIVRRLKTVPTLQEEKIQNDHIIMSLNRAINDKTHRLISLYSDQSNELSNDLKKLTVESDSSDPLKLFTDFHNTISALKSSYVNKDVTFVSTFQIPEVENSERYLGLFSGEETNGKFLDFFAIFQTLNNIPFPEHSDFDVQSIKYTDFLDFFYDFDNEVNITIRYLSPLEHYLDYLKQIKTYLVSFLTRSKPLEEFDKHVSDIETSAHEHSADYSLKSALEDKYEYCVYCGKKFAKASVFGYHKKSAPHLKNVTSKSALTAEIELLMSVIHTICLREDIQTTLKDTKENISTKMGRTATDVIEIERGNIEFLQDEVEIKKEDVEAPEEQQRGIDNYPIGEDGKPIPVWLYKFRGLGTMYYCEICGGCGYKGRKNYEKHFEEAKHIRGLKCLGIESSIEYFDICRIKDAISLKAKLDEMKKMGRFDVMNEAEYEDPDGNLILKKDYDMLKRQGLI